MPDTHTTPDEKTGPIARDPLMGLEVPVYLGGEELVVEQPAGDRGDALSSEPPSTEPEAPPAPEPETKPEELTDEQKAALPQRDPETGRFLPKDGEPGAKDEEAKGEEAKDEDQPRIPKVRLDKEIQRRKEAEAKLAEKEAAEKAAEKGAEQTYDFDAAEEEYMNLLLDGKLEEAKAKRREIRAAEKAEFKAVAKQESVATNTETDLRKAIDAVATEMESAFPGFDPKSEQFDEAAMVQAKAIYQGYLDSGMYESPVEALRAALLTTAAANHWEPATGAKPKAKTQTTGRTAAGRVAAIAGQPPLAAVAGQSGAAAGAAVVPNLADLTDEQLAKLPPATLKRLRGDEL